MTGEQTPDGPDLEVLQLLDANAELRALLAAAEARVAELERALVGAIDSLETAGCFSWADVARAALSKEGR